MAVLSNTEKFKIALSHSYFNQLINQRQRLDIFDGVFRPALKDLAWGLKLSRGCFYTGITMFVLGIISLRAPLPKSETLLNLRASFIVCGATLTAISSVSLFKLIKQAEIILSRLLPQAQMLEGGLQHLLQGLAGMVPPPQAGRPAIGRIHDGEPPQRRAPQGAPAPHVWGRGQRLGENEPGRPAPAV